MNVDISKFPSLREEQRLAAKQQAKENLLTQLGGEPRFEDYERRVPSRYSPGVEQFMNRGMWALLVAAFTLSAIHIYFAASDAYGLGIKSPYLSAVGGLMFVVVAEIAAILFSTAPAVYDQVMTKSTKRMSYSASIVAAIIAVVFNIAVAIDYHSSPFDWVIKWVESIGLYPVLFFVATTPPIFVLVAGQVQKTRILAQNERRYSAQIDYNAAMAEWEQIVKTIEGHNNWLQTYATALWDVWRHGKRRDLIAVITIEEQRAIVQREMEANNWYISGISTEIQRNSVKEKDDQTPPREIVLKYLNFNPEAAEMNQADLASQLGVSPATVNRAIQAFRSNGYSNGHHEE
jgi:hypothetical protein